MGKIYKVISSFACEALKLSEVESLDKTGIIMVPENEKTLTIHGGKIQEVSHVKEKK